MSRGDARNLAGLGLATLAVTLAATGVAAAPPGSPWGASYFPNVSLVTQDGQAVRFYDDLVKDKRVVISFVYTSCRDACPLETAKLVQVQRLLGDRVGRHVVFYSITIDPERDTPAALKRYAAAYRVGPGWLFLTGKRADIDLLRKKLGLFDPRDGDGRVDHTANIVIGNEATGQWIRHSALENPQFLAMVIRDRLDNREPTTPGRSYSKVPRPAARSKGQYLFETRCAACHTLGRGDGLGPDLLGVTIRRDRTWLARYLKAPDLMLAARDPIATSLFTRYGNVSMPNLRLSETDIGALLSYLAGERGGRRRDHPCNAESIACR